MNTTTNENEYKQQMIIEYNVQGKIFLEQHKRQVTHLMIGSPLVPVAFWVHDARLTIFEF